MQSYEIRQKFLEFFKSREHTIVPSGPLVPGDDPTLLFTNAGMVQFKDVFLGKDKRPYVRAVSAQRCIRAGGKHNDLENVGYTARHHTFFEMLGNFSFGDYFKREAIQYAWEFLTVTLKIPRERLWVTVYSEDDVAANIWLKEIGIISSQLVRISSMDNFWQMGETGPCGPCSEIFYDHGPDFLGGPPGSPDEDNGRYVEIWNLVFMQYNRDSAGKLHSLPSPSVDTGMGLERISAVMQHVHSNYETDLFRSLIRKAAEITNINDHNENSLKVIADHIRACSFLITDGVIPDNDGRGYVLRRIIRRAIRHGYQLGQKKKFFNLLVEELVNIMGSAYPELGKEKIRVMSVLKQEEERFGETLGRGMQWFEKLIRIENRGIGYVREKYEIRSSDIVTAPAPFDGILNLDEGGCIAVQIIELSDKASISKFKIDFVTSINNLSQKKKMPVSGHAIIIGSKKNKLEETGLVTFHFLNKRAVPFAGRDAFTLYDTFGFPKDLTQDLCRERGLVINEKEFEREMQAQRDRARKANKFTMESGIEYSGGNTQFHGYDSLQHTGQVVGIYKTGNPVDSIGASDEAVIVLDHTPFYAESGGQVGDQGVLLHDDGKFVVIETQKIQSDVYGHRGHLQSGQLSINDMVLAKVDSVTRARTERNHSVTHLMHKALREVLGSHVEQKGSLVDADKTRFDFSHNLPLTDEEIYQIEAIVNAEIFTNTKTNASVMKMDEAQKTGAVMLFGEKYGEEVRVLKIGSSQELCGGTHVNRTGDIGLFKIRMQSGVAAGVRRIEAVTGDVALAYVQQNDLYLMEIAKKLKTKPEDAIQKLSQLNDSIRRLEKDLSQLKSKLVSSQESELIKRAQDVKGVKVLTSSLENVDIKTMREILDRLKEKLKTCIVVFGAVSAGKVQLITGVTEDLTKKIKAGELVNFVAMQVGGKGGGRADIAQAGGAQPEHLEKALNSVLDWVDKKL
ncbi:MAG: alanine--tRNA ligase [Nitrosomonadaceae bacterium]|nr:alanine--tRNA ligase [Nitrosomonadaceae bacterium]|tara:strand:- start:17102 stop:19990 length:2889 start_codon:yes stop_codon:yes gene_type:complete